MPVVPDTVVAVWLSVAWVPVKEPLDNTEPEGVPETDTEVLDPVHFRCFAVPVKDPLEETEPSGVPVTDTSVLDPAHLMCFPVPVNFG